MVSAALLRRGETQIINSDGDRWQRLSAGEPRSRRTAGGGGAGKQPPSDVLVKVLRLKEAMTQIFQKLKDIKESQLDFRHQISLLVKPMLQALEAVFAHYETKKQQS